MRLPFVRSLPLLKSAPTPESSPKKSWSATLRLPKSSLPARPPIQRPSPYLCAITDDLYRWNISRPSSQTTGTFVLHDGPPYANGALHIGHALNKILKDIINRFWLGQGKRVEFVPGWDCHGLPIEIKALQRQAEKSHHGGGEVGKETARERSLRANPIAVRKAASNLAEKTVKEQMAGFKQWGVMGDWDGAYMTMSRDYELRQLRIFKGMAQKGLVYRKNRPVYWSPSSETALAEAELEYVDNHRSTSAFVAFPLLGGSSSAMAQYDFFKDVSLVVWTTTPWTLPANRAVAVNENLFYEVVECNFTEKHRQRFLVEKSRVEYFQSHLLSEFPTAEFAVIVQTVSGASLVGATYRNPLIPGKPFPVIHADFVSASSGTGLVHLAPGHGMEDYEVCEKHGITSFAPVDGKGRFTDEALLYNQETLAGKRVSGEGVDAVLDHLRKRGKAFDQEFLLATHEIRHRYPIDWRTKEPVIIRATEQWFADVGNIKNTAIEALKDVQFIPETGRSRLESFISRRSEWCISRQRAWGVPIPTLYRIDDRSNEAIMDEKTLEHIIKVVEERGTHSWWTDTEDEQAWIPPHLNGSFRRGKDTMDVWFDSGTSWALLDRRAESESVADVYFEGSDQHRGWFQSSLLTHVANRGGVAPFKTLVTHGFTLDQNGRKMSKSLGNVVSPEDIMNGTLLPPAKTKSNALGPDALRLWVASSDYTRDVVIGQRALQTVNDTLVKYRITLKWLLGCLSDFHPLENNAWSNKSAENMKLIDRIALHQLAQVEQTVFEAFSRYEFYKATKALEAYISVDLSAFYFETLKDRIYAGTNEDRLAAQAVLYRIFDGLLAMFGPIVPLMVEEVWSYAPDVLKARPSTDQQSGKRRTKEDYHPLRRVWKPIKMSSWSMELDAPIAEIKAVHTAVKAASEKAREQKKMGSSLECDVAIELDSLALEHESIITREMEAELAAILVVSDVRVNRNSRDDDRKSKTDGSSNPCQRLGNDEDTGQVSWSFSAPIESREGKILGRVIVSKPKAHKCPRCWRYVAKEEDHLCGRCEIAIEDAL